RFMNTLFQNKQAMNKTKQKKRPFFTMWSLKSRGFKDRCHGQRPAQQQASPAVFKGIHNGQRFWMLCRLTEQRKGLFSNLNLTFQIDPKEAMNIKTPQ
ncbi:hypothetical protein, partial [Arenibacter sp. F20364]|uniref:hypothetical protein n=1 Tax=Arenibacter sp. F20364 TaxID=2926415 RepID=UPI001FF2CAB3